MGSVYLPRHRSQSALYQLATVSCGNCRKTVSRNEVLILDHCSHALCEDCMNADTGPDDHFQCPICRKEQTVSRPATQQSLLRRLEVANESFTPTSLNEDSHQLPHSALHLARRHFTASDSIRIANASSSSSTSANGGRQVLCVSTPRKCIRNMFQAPQQIAELLLPILRCFGVLCVHTTGSQKNTRPTSYPMWLLN